MVFASLAFLYVFLPLNLILYYIYDNNTYRNLLLTAFSLVFYAWGEPVWIILLIISATVDYGNALFIEKFRGTKWARLGIISTVVVNIGLLATFKYSSFIVGNINFLFNTHLQVPGFSLPIGISFYTFQTISYVIDVYKGEVKAQHKYLNFLMFVSLYHQLVAGPIVRYAHIAKEIEHRRFDINDVSKGVTRFCIGLFKKVCIANIAGELAAKYMGTDHMAAGEWLAHINRLSVSESWYGVFMYSLQIYFDFSAYSDMAIGLGWMFGFHYHENFMYPYISKSATEFWRRWHISLGTFFRDYVYIPLGGNRKHQYFNLLVVWFLTGMWHGASWNFILWGLYFGFLIAIERLFLLKILLRIPAFIGHVYLLFAAIVGWALFYFTDFTRLWQYLQVMFFKAGHALTSFEFGFVFKEHLFWMLISIILCMPVYHWVNKLFEQNIIYRKRYAVWAIVLLLFNFGLAFMATSMLVGKSYNPFIYYRF